MKLSFRWYGESDSISLEYIRQIPNMRSIVSAVYDVAPGEVWPMESLERMKQLVEQNGMLFDIVESVPVHENIKLGIIQLDFASTKTDLMYYRDAKSMTNNISTEGVTLIGN